MNYNYLNMTIGNHEYEITNRSKINKLIFIIYDNHFIKFPKY
jgi:hypothetical protein